MTSYEDLKEKGNEAFRSKKYDKAIDFYTQAIQAKNDEPAAYSNRAMCHIHLGNFYEAKEDCDRAIKYDPKFVKAYYRRATALSRLFRYRLAKRDFRIVLDLDPSNSSAKKEIDNIDNLIDSDARVDLKAYSKPEYCQSNKPVREIELRNRYSGTISYDNE